VLAQNRWIRIAQSPSALLAGAGLFLLAYFALLSPSALEDDFNGVRIVNPKDLLNFLKNETESTLAKGVPVKITPAYSLRDFDFFATNGEKPQMKFSGRKANFYQKEQLLHAKDDTVTMSNNTVVTSKEAVYDTVKNVIEFYGDVVTTFDNGVVVHSNYMKVITRPIMIVTIPVTEPVSGIKHQNSSTITFKSYGLTYMDQEPKEVHLTSQVYSKLIDEHTTEVQSDQAKMDFTRNKLYFTMTDQKPLDQQFVLTHQGTLEMKSRIAELDFKSPNLDMIYAINDVSVHDRTFSSTSGKATFVEETNQIRLTDFPQVYQYGSDTITGELIIYNRNEDTIEAKESNAIYTKQHGE